MEVVLDKRNVIQDCGAFSRAKSTLIYTPSGFQDPFQLLHLKETWFHHLYSLYCFHTRLLENQSEIDQLMTHYAIIGFINSSDSYSITEDSQPKWHIQLLSSVLGVPVTTLLSHLPQQCHSEQISFMDKLDLIENINFPLAQRRSELEAVLKEDICSIEQRTRIFELEFDSFLQKLEPVASQFEVVLSSLFSLFPSGGVSICEAAQALRQRIFWINSNLFTAVKSIYGVTVIPLTHRDRDTVIVCLQREDQQPGVLLCARIVSPMSVLHWYEHQMAQKALSGVNRNGVDTSSNSFHGVHQWTPNCYTKCDWQ